MSHGRGASRASSLTQARDTGANHWAGVGVAPGLCGGGACTLGEALSGGGLCLQPQLGKGGGRGSACVWVGLCKGGDGVLHGGGAWYVWGGAGGGGAVCGRGCEWAGLYKWWEACKGRVSVGVGTWPCVCAQELCTRGGAHLPQDQLPVHVHGQVAKVQEHLVGGQLLLDDVIPVDGHDGHADEKVEVVRLRGLGGEGERGGSGRPWPRPGGAPRSCFPSCKGRSAPARSAPTAGRHPKEGGHRGALSGGHGARRLRTGLGQLVGERPDTRWACRAGWEQPSGWGGGVACPGQGPLCSRYPQPAPPGSPAPAPEAALGFGAEKAGRRPPWSQGGRPSVRPHGVEAARPGRAGSRWALTLEHPARWLPGRTRFPEQRKDTESRRQRRGPSAGRVPRPRRAHPAAAPGRGPSRIRPMAWPGSEGLARGKAAAGSRQGVPRPRGRRGGEGASCGEAAGGTGRIPVARTGPGRPAPEWPDQPSRGKGPGRGSFARAPSRALVGHRFDYQSQIQVLRPIPGQGTRRRQPIDVSNTPPHSTPVSHH